MSFISITSIICITLFGLFGSFLIFTNQGNRMANKLIGGFFFLWALDFLDGLLLIEGFYMEHPNFALWGESLVFLYGPLLYFYTLSITKNPPFRWKFTLHLIPYFISLGLTIVNFHLLPKANKIEILNTIFEFKLPIGFYLFSFLIYVHFFGYIYFSKKHIRSTIKQLNNLYSHHNLSWLNIILNSFLVILTISICVQLLQYNQSKLYFQIGLPILIIVMGVFIVGVILNSLNKPYLFLNNHSKIKYADYRLNPDDSKAIAKLITKALEKEKLYLNPELNLEDLAKTISYSSRQVSQVINNTFEKSFFDLINSYRIRAATEKFKKNKDSKLTILEVMYEVGFNSKSSFNTQFKNRTGLTPTEYKKLN